MYFLSFLRDDENVVFNPYSLASHAYSASVSGPLLNVFTFSSPRKI